MRLLKLVGVLSLVVILSTGCYKNDNSSENPINLFDELPIYNQEKKDISDKAKRIAGSANLILPYNSIEVGKINEVDLNNDGKNEVVFFEKRENINNEVGFTVLESKDDESKDALYTESGDKIKYANFYDLDNDGNKEIILVVEEKNETTLTICRYENGEIKELVSKNNYDYFNKDKSLKLGIVVNDIDNEVVNIVRQFNDAFQSVTARREIKKKLRAILWVKYQIKDNDVFERAYQYIEMYY